MASVVTNARALAESLLAEALPRRWRHVRAVAAKAEHVSTILEVKDRSVLVAAAWLHDVGYAPDLAATGFHPLDGARWLDGQGFDRRIAALVAHHSGALIEASERGLASQLAAEFRHEDSPVSDALWYSDMTTGPDGQVFEVAERLAEIRSRYGSHHLVTRFVVRAEAEIVGAVRRTKRRLAESVDTQPMWGSGRSS